MASGLLLFFTLIVAVYAISASARPCKTIFFITSSSNNNQLPPKPTFQLLPNYPNPRLTFFVTEIRQFRTLPRPMLFDRTITSSSTSDVVTSEPYFSTSVKASIRERTMDIMSIVGAVLFGVGCGAVTAATMYLFWSLFVPRRFDFCSDSEESDDEEKDVNNKDGYVAVPATKLVPPTADEVAAMK